MVLPTTRSNEVILHSAPRVGGGWLVPELRTLVAGIIQLNAFLCIELNVEWPARSPPLKGGQDALTRHYPFNSLTPPTAVLSEADH